MIKMKYIGIILSFNVKLIFTTLDFTLRFFWINWGCMYLVKKKKCDAIKKMHGASKDQLFIFGNNFG